MSELTELRDPTASRIRVEQLNRWESGRRVLIEDLLGSFSDEDALLDLIYGEVLLREEQGESPSVEEYVRRFPHLAVALRRQFELHDALSSLNASSTTTRITRLSDPDHPYLAVGSFSRPERIGDYEIEAEIGRGGMGIVYRARHRLLPDRIAAVKVIRPGSDDPEELKRRFVAEASAVAGLDHVNIVRIFEVQLAEVHGEEMPVVVLEHVAGGSLSEALDGTPLAPRDAARLVEQLAAGVAHAHGRGIIHRDLKPANILLASVGRQSHDASPGTWDCRPTLAEATPKIADFGLAKRMDGDSSRTRTGAIVGTPSYMAPEQADGDTKRVGPPADIHALGAILYECLTGRPPFKADTVLRTLEQVSSREPAAPRMLNPDVPRDLEVVCLKCLEKSPERRYSSAADLADDLHRFLSGEPIRARPAGMIERASKWVRRHPAGSGLIAVCVAAVGVFMAVWISFTIRLGEETAYALKQRDEAEKQERLAKQERERALSQTARAGQLLELAAGSVDEIARNVRGAKTDELATGNTGSVLFKLACSYAKTSSVLRSSLELDARDRDRLAEQYALSAIRLLRCAQDVGFFSSDRPKNRQALDTVADLQCLRDRKDYREFKAELQ